MKTTIRLYIFLLFCIGSFSLFAQDAAYPLRNDDVSSFLKRWQRYDDRYSAEFMRLNKGKIGAENRLLLGTEYRLPKLREGDLFCLECMYDLPVQPWIFGDKYTSTAPKSQALKDACFFILSGHGGPDPGAVAVVDGVELHEDEYAYDVSLRLAHNLMLEGATVYMIIQDENDGIRDEKILGNSNQETCMGDEISRSQTDRLKQGVKKINYLHKRNKDKFRYFRTVSIHVDSRSQDKRIDVFFYHSQDPKSQTLTTHLRNIFQEKYDRFQPGRGFEGTVSYRNLYILRHLENPSTLVEIGNIQNPNDRVRLVLRNNRQAMANWMTLGLLRDFQSDKTK